MEAKEPLTATVGASVTARFAGEQAMNAPVAAKQYKKQQNEVERQREMLEKTKDFIFINMMLKSLGMGERK